MAVMQRRTISLSDEVDERVNEELEHGDSRSAVFEAALREYYDDLEAAHTAHDEPRRSEPADFGGGDSTGVQDL